MAQRRESYSIVARGTLQIGAPQQFKDNRDVDVERSRAAGLFAMGREGLPTGIEMLAVEAGDRMSSTWARYRADCRAQPRPKSREKIQRAKNTTIS